MERINPDYNGPLTGSTESLPEEPSLMPPATPTRPVPAKRSKPRLAKAKPKAKPKAKTMAKKRATKAKSARKRPAKKGTKRAKTARASKRPRSKRRR